MRYPKAGPRSFETIVSISSSNSTDVGDGKPNEPVVNTAAGAWPRTAVTGFGFNP